MTQQSSEVRDVLAQIERPARAVITAGMPYANGPLHLGHLAGAQVPADVHTRWMGMLIGRDNVLFVNGTDDHGSTSEVAALQAGVPIREFIDGIHAQQKTTLQRYSIGVDVYSGTSRPECYPLHRDLSQSFLRRLHRNGMLQKRTSQQWFDPVMERFLPDRYVKGTCPNPKCGNKSAYSDACEVCGLQYDPSRLIDPKSAISNAVPVMKETAHLWLDMGKVSEVLREWIQGNQGKWRKALMSEALGTVLPSFRFDAAQEDAYKGIAAELPEHKRQYAPGKKIALQFESKADLDRGRKILEERLGVATELRDEWAHRAITRDVPWGIPVPEDIDPEMKGKTLYVWPDSLIAPISFTQVALAAKASDPARFSEFWCDPKARIYQFIGQDNVFFYVLMQGAMWLGTQADPMRPPIPGEYQMTDVFPVFHLQVNGEKMSKSRGNFYSGDQLLDELGYDADQVRYFLSTLSLPEKRSNFEFKAFDEKVKFLAGPLNSAFEKPISAVHSKFGGKVPEGVLDDKVRQETVKIVKRYAKSMERAEYSSLLGEIENYARSINSLFNKHKPHDDRFPEEERKNALYSSFYVLKHLMIMLYPFAPRTMERLRESLRLRADVFRVDELGVPIPAGHEVGAKQTYFPPPRSKDPNTHDIVVLLRGEPDE